MNNEKTIIAQEKLQEKFIKKTLIKIFDFLKKKGIILLVKYLNIYYQENQHILLVLKMQEQLYSK